MCNKGNNTCGRFIWGRKHLQMSFVLVVSVGGGGDDVFVVSCRKFPG